MIKKIVFYISSVGDGGAQRVVANLVNQFSKKNYKVILVTEYPRENEYYVNPLVRRIYLQESAYSKSRFIKNLTWVKRIRKICKKEQADALISFMAEPNYRSVAATIGISTKCIISVRNDPNFEYQGITGKILGRYFLPLADGCVFQTNEAKSWFPNKLQKKSIIIRNAVNDSFYQGKWQPNELTAIACGRLNKQKDYYVMIDAIRILHQNGKDIILNIFGVGEEEEKITDYIKEKGLEDLVILKGRTNNVASELEKASVFLLSSDYEGMPNALMEAMAIGVPSISTDCPCGGPRDLLKDECGLLVPVGDSLKFAEAISKILNNKELANKYSKNAKAKANEFKPNTVYKEWEFYLETICTDNRRK